VINEPTRRRPRPSSGTRCHRHRDDAGGVWIATAVVLGVLMYGFIVLMDVAGFTEVLPLVVLPPVVLGLIAANNLLRGGGSQGGSTGGRQGAHGPHGPDGRRPAGDNHSPR
jgi:hypothetical protein